MALYEAFRNGEQYELPADLVPSSRTHGNAVVTTENRDVEYQEACVAHFWPQSVLEKHEQRKYDDTELVHGFDKDGTPCLGKVRTPHEDPPILPSGVVRRMKRIEVAAVLTSTVHSSKDDVVENESALVHSRARKQLKCDLMDDLDGQKACSIVRPSLAADGDLSDDDFAALSLHPGDKSMSIRSGHIAVAAAPVAPTSCDHHVERLAHLRQEPLKASPRSPTSSPKPPPKPKSKGKQRKSSQSSGAGAGAKCQIRNSKPDTAWVARQKAAREILHSEKIAAPLEVIAKQLLLPYSGAQFPVTSAECVSISAKAEQRLDPDLD